MLVQRPHGHVEHPVAVVRSIESVGLIGDVQDRKVSVAVQELPDHVDIGVGGPLPHGE